MKCRPATSADIPEMTRIITEGFLDYPFHLTLKPYVYQTERYPQCLAVLNEMMAKAYLASRNALVVEHEGQVIAVALMHDRPIGLWRNVVSGGYRLFRYASPLLVALPRRPTTEIRSLLIMAILTGISRFCRSISGCRVGE